MSKPRPLQTLDEVAQALRNGASCGVLVEGEEQASDAWILKTLLLSSVGEEVTFHGRDGRERLRKEFPGVLTRFPNDSVFAILDRDFLEDTEAETGFAPDYLGHVFVWRRFTIENYLLEPEWLVETVGEFYMHEPERIPASLRTAEGVEKFILDWCRRLAAQAAGSWVISDLTRATANISVPARGYFEELTDRDVSWVLDELNKSYGGWGDQYPDLFGPKALQTRFEDRLNLVSAKVEAFAGANQVISGKVLLKALYAELPGGPKPPREYFRNRLVKLASQRVPEDIRVLVVERILPRWRRARGFA